MVFGQKVNSHTIFKRLANALTSLRVCAGWSEPLLAAHYTMLEITCQGSIVTNKWCIRTYAMRGFFSD